MAPKPDHIDRLLKDYSTILPRLRGEFPHANCPLTADALWAYLQTGETRVAKQLIPGIKIVACGSVKVTTLHALKKELLKGGHGYHVVVTKNVGKDPGEHSLNAVNIRGKLYVMDAYVKPPVLSHDLEFYIGKGQIEITRKADIHMVPAESVLTYRCPA